MQACRPAPYNGSMPQINQPAPDFELPDLDGNRHSTGSFRGRIVIVNFWSCECAHSERTDHTLGSALTHWGDQVVLLNVAPNTNETPEAIRAVAQERGISTVLLDTGQAAADLYGVEITPHTFVIDRQGILRYQGPVDDVAYRQRTPTRFYVEEAVEALLEERMPEVQEQPPFGCAIVRGIWC
jgi:peroxiredoxin